MSFQTTRDWHNLYLIFTTSKVWWVPEAISRYSIDGFPEITNQWNLTEPLQCTILIWISGLSSWIWKVSVRLILFSFLFSGKKLAYFCFSFHNYCYSSKLCKLYYSSKWPFWIYFDFKKAKIYRFTHMIKEGGKTGQSV